MRLVHARAASTVPLILILALVLCVFALSGCGDQGAETTTTVPTSPDTASGGGTGADPTGGETEGATDGQAALEVTGPDGTRSYTLDELKALPATEGYGGHEELDRPHHRPTKVKGVCSPISSPTSAALPMTWPSASRQRRLRDDHLGGAAHERRIPHLDMATGDEIDYDGTRRRWWPTRSTGKPIDPNADGPLRLAIVSASGTR